MSARSRSIIRLFVLILQHPQEKKEALATAALTARAAGPRRARRRAVVAESRARPRPLADARRWAVLYLGSARPAAFDPEREVVVLDRRGEPAADQDAMLRGLDGVVLLDGSWSEAKTLWWRNPWLLKLRRLVLNPRHRSRFGRVRREPRREALVDARGRGATAEASRSGGPEIEAALLVGSIA